MHSDITSRPGQGVPKDVLQQIALGTFDDPFAVLGPHGQGDLRHVTALMPGAETLEALLGHEADACAHALAPVPDCPGLFTGPVPGEGAYRLRASAGGTVWEADDPYRFGPVLGEMDEHLIAKGAHRRLWEALGAHAMTHEGVAGTHFAVWAPNARRVSVVGPFNQWDGRRHVMRRRGTTGVWEIFLPGIGENASYKYEILGPDGTLQPLKADPMGFGSEHPPANASVVHDLRGYGWSDGDWMRDRAGCNARTAPISIYEVHLASWKRRADGRAISYVEAAEELVDYAAAMGFTHIELMPVSEYPFDGSWGYQPVGLYAPTVRHGPPHEFRDLVDAAHRKGLGVILDWVGAHFPTDAHGLGKFDGTALYEYADPREGFHQDWNTLIYNFGRTEVANYLTANALYWMEEYHVDGLRADAVASMLYRDYSRKAGEWVPNKDGGRENYEAIALLQQMNTLSYGTHPGTLTAAEESTAYPGVTRPVDQGGLGFGYKWNMGWMHDTLGYMAETPVNRPHHHNRLTFGLTYAFSENFILPISHDEVVYGKGSMLTKMPGDRAEKFANLRAFYGFMWAQPGKKLLFMGQDFAQEAEWAYAGSLDWAALERPDHAGMQRLVRDLNTLYRGTPALHAQDCSPEGFQWIEADDARHSVYAWLRRGGPEDPNAVAICNFSPVERPACRLGLPAPGRWREALNTDAAIYGGQGRGNMGAVMAEPRPSHGQAASAEICLPPLSTVILVQEDG
ncbi:1,4-alpha-glucan branching protein GlgB [Rhodovulum sulfidophilum]|uniref:1,4-alpha-glucan branching protein GlgB n=1 Tax=Rhodovulum sulfidophilum TaxID=35806 RepID=UPI001926E6FF|nr:1,4-alpha-glucan branching protein GlgB [Rhodovulum sulfidophilum]MBL3584382.1 1,4-alpha-glucan branching protein GlgB [Rhodovulum sulfidophilum]